MNYLPSITLVLSAWFVVASIVRLARVAKKHSGADESPRGIEPIISASMMLVAGSLLSLGILWGAGVFFTGRIWTTLIVLGSAILISCGLDFFGAVRFSRSREAGRWKMLGAMGSLILGAIFFGFIFHIMTPPIFGAMKVALDYPVKGEWVVATGGKTRHTNYHHGNPEAQNFAVDLVLREGNSFGEPIYAPVDGRVIRTIGDRSGGGSAAEGNVVVIETSEGIEIRLAHLAQGSLQVQTGEAVTTGQPIARCGATGSAAAAHLHIHAEKDGNPVAMSFGKRKRFLIRNDRIRTAP